LSSRIIGLVDLINVNLKLDIYLMWPKPGLEFFRVLVPEIGLKIEARLGSTHTYLIDFCSFCPIDE
jgi:hypothetical protein